MLKKNLELYLEKYRDISFSMEERLINFIITSKIKEKDSIKLSDMISDRMNIKRQQLICIFYIIPESTPRPRLRLSTGKFYVKNSSSNKKFCELLIEKEKDLFNIITTPTKFICNTYMPIPNGMNRFEKIMAELGYYRPVVDPDWDNLGKTYSDMVKNTILLDDRLIQDGEVHKYYSLKPRVEILFDYLIDYDCKYNKKLVEKSKSYKDYFSTKG